MNIDPEIREKMRDFFERAHAQNHRYRALKKVSSWKQFQNVGGEVRTNPTNDVLEFKLPPGYQFDIPMEYMRR